MTERLRILVDSEVLAVPRPPIDNEGAEGYVATLVALTEFLLDHRFLIVRSDHAWEVLESSDSCPPWDGSPLDHVVAGGDLLSLFLGVIERCSTITVETGIADALVAGEEVRPSDHLAGRSDPFRNDYLRSLVFWWIPSDILPSSDCAPFLTVGIGNHTEVDLVAELHDVEPATARGGDLPCEINGTTTHLSSLSKLAAAIDPVRLLQNQMIDLAFRAEIAQRNGGLGTWLEHDVPYAMHPDFLPSADARGFLSDAGRAARLLRACVDILTDERLDQTHWIREGSGGGDPQLFRSKDGAAAWRKDIDYEYHLHYWKLGGHVEFAVVADHRSAYIPS